MRAAPALLVMAAGPARAEFLGDVRRTFTQDVPRVFQHDIPRAFWAERARRHVVPTRRAQHYRSSVWGR